MHIFVVRVVNQCSSSSLCFTHTIFLYCLRKLGHASPYFHFRSLHMYKWKRWLFVASYFNMMSFHVVQGTLPLKELSICNLQQNCNHSQPEEYAFQINGRIFFTRNHPDGCWHRALVFDNDWLCFIGYLSRSKAWGFGSYFERFQDLADPV